jgi:hypothetical protein
MYGVPRGLVLTNEEASDAIAAIDLRLPNVCENGHSIRHIIIMARALGKHDGRQAAC